jgi:plastocyanin
VRFLISWVAGGMPELLKITLVFCALWMGSCVNLDSRRNREPQPQVHEVEIKKFRFKPATLSIDPGDLVRWVNKDIVPHRVADAERGKWQSQDMAPEDFFSEPILVSTTYICTLHPGMQAKIVMRNH